MSPRIKLIINPLANLGRAWQVAAALRPVASQFGQADWVGTVYPTHATEIAAQAAREGYDWVVAMGGDGTIHEVINGLMQVPAAERPKLGIVPVGSGNDFAFSLSLSRKPEVALRHIFSGVPRPLDIGLVEDNLGRKEYWNNTLGIGFDAIVNIHSRKVPIVRGFAIYFAAVVQAILLNHHPNPMQVIMDGKKFEKSLLMFIMANGRREGGGFLVSQDGRQDDNRLEYNLVGSISRLRMIMSIPPFLKGTQAALPYVETGQFQQLELQASRPMQIHTDGEVFAGFDSQTTSLKVRVIPGEITTVCG
jgi:diacylglycerol kinase (ATP)